MQKILAGTILNNRYKITNTYKIEVDYIAYRVEDIRFIGSSWILYQISISEYNTSQNYLSNLYQFLSSLSKIVYEKIGKIVDYFIEKQYLMVICEEINGTLLSDIIHSSKTNHIKAIKLALQLLEIVRNLHERNIIHLVDLRPDNIVIDKQGIVKIQSLAISKIPAMVTEKGIEEKYVGTIGYIPPEMLDDDKSSIGEYSYIYIVASIVYEYLTKLSPYLREDPFFFPPASSVNPTIPPQISSLLEKSLNSNPNERIKTFKEFEKKLASILKSETNYEQITTKHFPIHSILTNKVLILIAIFVLIQLTIIVGLVLYYTMYLR
ncbi:MAG: protein kinase [bacterium]